MDITTQEEQCETKSFWCWQRQSGAVIFVIAVILLAVAYVWGEFNG